MQKCHIVYLKCEDKDHYKRNCLLCPRYWLLCPSYSEYKAARTYEDLEHGASPGFFLFHSENSYVSKEYSFTKHNTLLHAYTYIFLRNAYGPLMQTVWSIHGILVL
jgi:hypothetical protein